jgi:hypothetical protein
VNRNKSARLGGASGSAISNNCLLLIDLCFGAAGRFQDGTSIATYKKSAVVHERKQIIMEFRWVALITLWTMLIGPVMDMPLTSPRAHPNHVHHRSTAKLRSGR